MIDLNFITKIVVVHIILECIKVSDKWEGSEANLSQNSR